MISTIPKSHPRYKSLVLREKISNGLKNGLVHETGLIAHGRGEAFDYIIGEKTQGFSDVALRASAEVILSAKNPVLSLNGNVISLVAEECIRLASIVPLLLEVNLFHRSRERVELLIKELKKVGAGNNKFEVQAKMMDNGRPVTSEVTDFNLFFTLDKALKQIQTQLAK